MAAMAAVVAGSLIGRRIGVDPWKSKQWIKLAAGHSGNNDQGCEQEVGDETIWRTSKPEKRAIEEVGAVGPVV
ncbi:hypothetical protein RHMOL_Rhmol01G0162300 [Rhododendron molle]|uniref:Uncharacterized protein n=1 Tax=Rhododendron molle TaxID=49168 RepID=A0ACC0Q3E4_RHOML|nr:hypothetical protein RHMOL_Rhmol01G0162300 [Rhododendron molle]